MISTKRDMAKLPVYGEKEKEKKKKKGKKKKKRIEHLLSRDT